ncbi:hypothetical protein P12x_004667 [Tundrisphaera lichenicola]|uniref:hypothetical protein n=1 Tax=Tundrisphaera lichenicola TaxID=2029860 RepID=UPI003EBAB4C3
MASLPGSGSTWQSHLPLAFVIVGLPILVYFTNSRFPNTIAGDFYRLLSGLIFGCILAAIGYLVSKWSSR